MKRFTLTCVIALLFMTQALGGNAQATKAMPPCEQTRTTIAGPVPPSGPPPTPAGFWRNPQLAEKLELAESQVKALRDIDYTYLSTTLKLRAELDQLQLAHEKMAAENMEAEAREAIDQIAMLHADLFKVHAEARTAAAKTLKPEQMAILESHFDHMTPPKGLLP